MTDKILVDRELLEQCCKRLHDTMQGDLRDELRAALSAPVQYECKHGSDYGCKQCYMEEQAKPVQQQEPVGTYTCGSYAGLPWEEVVWEGNVRPPHGTKLYTHPAPADALVEALEKLAIFNGTFREFWALQAKAKAALAAARGK